MTPLDEILLVREVDDGPAIAGAMFEHRYRQPIPDFPIHVVAFHREPSATAACCYVHFTEVDALLFGGGACVDDRVVRTMPRADRAAIKAAGGLYFHTLSTAVRSFEGRYDAVFGYCGDPLAKRIDLAAGFVETRHDKLLVRWLRDVDEARRAAAIAKAASLMPF